MGCRFTIYSLFIDIQNSFLDIQKWISKNRLMDILKYIFGYPKINWILDIHKSKITPWFLDIHKSIFGYPKISWILDIHNSIYGYPKMNYGYPKIYTDFWIHKSIFGCPKISWILDIHSSIFGYPKMYLRISINRFLDIYNSFLDKCILGYP